MAEKRLSGRNAAIAEMLSDGEKLKNYYRFIAQNPHINLRDACHIILARPDATVCFSYDEWNALGRQVKKGAKSIAYYDYDGNIQYAFDLTDTRGEAEYQRHSVSLDTVLTGLNELNDTDYGNENVSDFEKVHRGVNKYFQNQDLLSDNEQRKEWLVEGVSYLIYAKTSFPKDEDITLWGLQYSYKENSEFVKEIYIQAQLLTQEIEDAYKNKQTQIEVIDDTEEETVSDEPTVPVEITEEVVEESETKLPDTVTPLYKKYVEAQKLKPDAVVIYRLGDFYEVMGENAKAIAAELDLTLTGRNVGLPERVPMCGVPYHAMDKYLDKILENHCVLLVDGEEEPKFILSKAEALEQSVKPQLEEIKDDEPTPFDNEQSDTDDDWRNELAEELGEIEDEQSAVEAEEAEDEEEADEDEETSEDYEDSDGTDDEDEEDDKPPKENRPAQKKEEKGIKDRKRKEKPQPTLFDLTESQEKSREEQLIENELKRGSHVADGKFRIFDRYNENPTAQAFITFLKREYGIGGSFSDDIDEMHDGKGIRIKFLDKANPENNIAVNLKWNEVANRIADLIDDDNYLTEQEKKKYVDYKIEQNRLREQRLEEERQKNRLINNVIFFASPERKQRILDEYAKTTELTAFAEFLKNEYGRSEERGEGYSATYNEMGVWIFKGEDNHGIDNRTYLKWEEFADKVCTLIEDNRYIEQPEEKLTDEQKIAAIVDNFVKEGTEKTTDGKWVVYFKDYKEDEQFVREHKYEIAEQLVSRKEVAQVGYDDDGIDASFPLEYCPNYDWNADGKEEEQPAKPNSFRELSQGSKAVFESYQKSYSREPTNSPWGEVQNCTIIANGIYDVSTEGHGGIMVASGLAPYILTGAALRVGFQEGGYYCFEEDCDASVPLRELYDTGILKTEEYFKYYSIPSEQPEAKDGRIYFYKATQSEKAEFIKRWNRSIDESLQQWNGEYWKAYEIINAEETDSGNTDLNGVLDQSELGGAKTRFKNNVAAIKLVNNLYAENRKATEEEKKLLAQFVGWGGLAQAFDDTNPQWKKENAELKTVLSGEDYAQARSSTLNAYYTPKSVIDGIYMALNRFGVKGNNRILEPAMGTGNFFGYMPKEISDGSRLYGVELDNLTGRIAAKLYPQANVQIKGFEDTTFPNDKFDIVVGNVPFGGYGVADSDYNRYNFKVHDYFLAKSIDKVKPNGIVAIVTSKGTMDKLNPSARKYVAERAELLGAIRLPNTAFKQTAGTEAVADILFFRKRTERINTETENIHWLVTGKTAEGFEINQHFIDHPEMVLGTLAEETGLYGGVDVTVKPDGRELPEALSEAIKRLPQGFYLSPETSPEEEKATEVDYNVKPMCYKAESGRLYMRVGDKMEEQPIPKFPKDAYQRIQAMIALREELHHVLDMQIQGCSDEQLMREQSSLNVMYDRFVRQYGNLNTQTNVRLFKDDGDSALLFACEDVDKETKAISKSDVFSKRTIRPYTVPTNTDDCFEALQISKNERGRVDLAYIEELTGKSFDDVLFELGDAVFRDPMLRRADDKYSGYVTSEEYLSGDVVAKLQTAKLVAENVPEYRRNVEALENVQPTPLTASEIAVRLGASWVDKEFYKQFYCQLVGVDWWSEGDVQLYYNPHDSSWRLDQKDSIRYQTQMKQKEVYGTTRAPAYRIFMDCMNLRPTTIYDLVEEDGKEKRVVNHAETIAAREKQNKIREEFDKWIFSNPERRYELEATYNRLFNHTRLPSYDGSYLKFPEMNPAIELREHQKNAVHRIITSQDGTLLHHVVGSGKTYTMAASIMKMRQLGLCKKAMIAVPNHLVQQWASEWRKLYPNAKLLIATKEDLDKDNRQRFVSKVAMGDWDGIIIAQSSFAKIPVSYERQVKKLNEEIEAVELTIKKAWEEQGMPRGAVKNLETIKKNKQAQLKKLMDGNGKDNVLNFESLGVDYLFVDEAHYYKNLFLYTKMSNVAGISNAASQRASDLKLKCEYLQEMHGNNRGVVFATGTPISNSMTEMYTMQTYLQPRALKESGLTFFDNWAADFGETITSMELMPSGQGYRARTRFAKFTNLPELLTMYRSFADVQTSDTVKLDVPEAERHVINLKPSDTVIELAEKIAERADDIYGGGVDPHEDNMLKVTSDGKKLALDPRCFIPDSKDEPISKLNEAAQRIFEIWENTADNKGTQIVFCDLSTPKKKFDDYVQGVDFDAYNELKHKLVQKGISRDEIAFIHDATTDESKQALFDKVNSGAVRVLIGSTEKCGAGTNVQKRLVALHHLDTPYRPSDMEQREGRIIRQGNINEKVDIYTYVTERTFDSYSYQILENKQRFISQINKGDLTVREAEDIDETTLSYAEIKAITAANPMIKRKMEVDTEIARLRVLEGQYKKNLYSLQDKIRLNFPEDIRKQELLIERATLDLMRLNSSKPADHEAFEISVNGKLYTDKKEGARALTDALYSSKPDTVVAEYCGFKISICPISIIDKERDITLAANGQYTISIGESATGNLQRIDNFLEDFPMRKERLEKRLQQLKDDLKIAEEQVKKPFEHSEHLTKLLSEQAELNAALNLDKKDDVIVGDGENVRDENDMDLPTPKEIREVKIIDEEDEVAAMKVEVLPDYSITQEEMHEYGYKWDGMLPVTKERALKFWTMGLMVCKLGSDDDHTEIDDYRDFNDDNAMYGIEKPVWKKFMDGEKSTPYLFARLHVTSAISNMISDEMSYIDDKFIGKFKEDNFRERANLEDFLPQVKQPDKDRIKSELTYSMDEATDRLWCDELKSYGWTKSDIPKSIAGHIADGDLKAYAENSTIHFNAQKELMLRLAGMSEEKIDDMNLPAFDDELTVKDKQPDTELNENDGGKQFLPGVLLLRNEVTGDYYVINDTSAKNEDGSELKVGDTTNVETVLAYNGLHDGNPLREFHGEKEAQEYFDDKVKAIHKVIAKSGNDVDAVISSVILEYDEYKAEMMKSTPNEVFHNNYKIHLYNEFSEVIKSGTEYLSESEFKALREEGNHILEQLFDDYCSQEGYNVETYGETAHFIQDYCESYHRWIYHPFTYYGRDTENRAYYRFTEPINYASLTNLKDEAEMHTIAANACYLNDEELERNHIFYLNISRDISEDELEETNAMTNMMNAMDRYKRIYPLYLQTAKYANEHYEMTAYRNSHNANEECKRAIDEAVRNNFDGMHLNEGFENKLIDEYGMERVAFIVATTINERGWDGRYSRDNKEWAKTIPMSESEDERRNCILNVHPAVLDAFVNRICKKMKEEEKALSKDETPEEVAKLIEFAASGDLKKTKAYYAFIYERGPNGTGSYQAYVLEEGETEMYPMFSDVIETEEDLEHKWNDLIKSKILAPMELVKCEPHELLKMSNQNKKEEDKEMAEQDKFLNVTKQGYKVLSITKDRDNRNIAIIHRENQGDYIVAARYDTSDGQWAQGEYCATLKAAEEYRNEKYGRPTNENTPGARNWIFAHVAKDAWVAKHQYSTFFKMPTNGEYAGYGYSIYNNRIKESRQLVDLESDTRELCYDIRLADDETVLLKHSSKEEIELPAREFMELVTGTSNKDYAPMPRVDINVPKEARIGVYDKSTMFALPDSAAEGKFTYFVPNRYIEKGTEENKDRFILSIPEDFVLKAQNKDEEVIEYTVQELHDICDGTSAEDYMGEESENEDGEEKSSWFYVTLDNAAKVAKFDNSTLFKMPKGDYEGYTYYISNAFIKENEEKGTIRIGIPETYNVKAKNNKTGDEINLTAEDYVDEVKNLPSDMYRYFQKPSEEAQKQFGKVEEKLRKNLPKEMIERPNWVAITTFEKENGKLGKRPVDCNTGKYASDTDSATWADFDTACSFAKANGMVTLAYALDGKDKIACIDIDGCMDENGDFSELAQKTFNLADGSYAEKSVSGKGLHIFGKTDGSDLRSFSKDGDVEYYRGARFIAVTGDNYGSSELKSFDTPEMKGLLESKFDKRPKITNANKGVEGFSTMDDREVYDRACNAYNGDTFKRLFNGEDLQNNHSNSDMALMNRLAFWCNGDREQMLRMFAASGLYRPEKSQNYYECTLLKALEGTTDRYNPKPRTEQKKPANGNGNNNGGKR